MCIHGIHECLCLAFGNYMRFDLHDGTKKKAAACTSKINTVSTVNGSTFQFRFAFQICFFHYFLLQNLIVVCEHKRINVFMFLHDHFISLVTALLRVAHSPDHTYSMVFRFLSH